MGKSALIGAIFAITAEGIAHHKRYKLGEISKNEFIIVITNKVRDSFLSLFIRINKIEQIMNT